MYSNRIGKREGTMWHRLEILTINDLPRADVYTTPVFIVICYIQPYVLTTARYIKIVGL